MTDPGRVVLVVDSPTYGGAERCVVQLVRGLPPDVWPEVLATEPVPEALVAAMRAAGRRLTTIPPIRDRPDGAALVTAAAAGLRPDVLHVNLIDPGTCLEALEGAVASGVPTVPDLHMTGTLGDGDRLERWGRAYRRCPVVVGRSAQAVEVVRLGCDLPEHRVRVVRNGVPIPPEGAVRAGRVGASRPLLVRAAGRLTEQKGFDLLIEAASRLAGRVDLRVEIAGEGPDQAALAARAEGTPVRLVGSVPDAPAFLAGADVFCLPSRGEALPLALLEALVAGRPCVATDVGDIRAAAGDLVRLIPPDDVGALAGALTELTEPAARNRLAARAMAEGPRRFDERRTVAEMLLAYRAALDSAAVLGTA